jgi:hypothetical protein
MPLGLAFLRLGNIWGLVLLKGIVILSGVVLVYRLKPRWQNFSRRECWAILTIITMVVIDVFATVSNNLSII